MNTTVFFKTLRSIVSLSIMLLLISCGGGGGGGEDDSSTANADIINNKNMRGV